MSFSCKSQVVVLWMTCITVCFTQGVMSQGTTNTVDPALYSTIPRESVVLPTGVWMGEEAIRYDFGISRRDKQCFNTSNHSSWEQLEQPMQCAYGHACLNVHWEYPGNHSLMLTCLASTHENHVTFVAPTLNAPLLTPWKKTVWTLQAQIPSSRIDVIFYLQEPLEGGRKHQMRLTIEPDSYHVGDLIQRQTNTLTVTNLRPGHQITYKSQRNGEHYDFKVKWRLEEVYNHGNAAGGGQNSSLVHNSTNVELNAECLNCYNKFKTCEANTHCNTYLSCIINHTGFESLMNAMISSTMEVNHIFAGCELAPSDYMDQNYRPFFDDFVVCTAHHRCGIMAGNNRMITFHRNASENSTSAEVIAYNVSRSFKRGDDTNMSHGGYPTHAFNGSWNGGSSSNNSNSSSSMCPACSQKLSLCQSDGECHRLYQCLLMNITLMDFTDAPMHHFWDQKHHWHRCLANTSKAVEQRYSDYGECVSSHSCGLFAAGDAMLKLVHEPSQQRIWNHHAVHRFNHTMLVHFNLRHAELALISNTTTDDISRFFNDSFNVTVHASLYETYGNGNGSKQVLHLVFKHILDANVPVIQMFKLNTRLNATDDDVFMELPIAGYYGYMKIPYDALRYMMFPSTSNSSMMHHEGRTTGNNLTTEAFMNHSCLSCDNFSCGMECDRVNECFFRASTWNLSALLQNFSRPHEHVNVRSHLAMCLNQGNLTWLARNEWYQRGLCYFTSGCQVSRDDQRAFQIVGRMENSSYSVVIGPSPWNATFTLEGGGWFSNTSESTQFSDRTPDADLLNWFQTSYFYLVGMVPRIHIQRDAVVAHKVYIVLDSYMGFIPRLTVAPHHATTMAVVDVHEGFVGYVTQPWPFMR